MACGSRHTSTAGNQKRTALPYGSYCTPTIVTKDNMFNTSCLLLSQSSSTHSAHSVSRRRGSFHHDDSSSSSSNNNNKTNNSSNNSSNRITNAFHLDVVGQGASRGLGAAIAKDLAGTGCSVIVNYAASSGAADEVRLHCMSHVDTRKDKSGGLRNSDIHCSPAAVLCTVLARAQESRPSVCFPFDLPRPPVSLGSTLPACWCRVTPCFAVLVLIVVRL